MIGKRGYTPGICEMTEMSQLYTRKCQKMRMYDAKLAYTWYTWLNIPGKYQIGIDVTSLGYFRPEETPPMPFRSHEEEFESLVVDV